MAVHPDVCRLIAFKDEIVKATSPVRQKIVDYLRDHEVLNVSKTSQLDSLPPRDSMRKLFEILFEASAENVESEILKNCATFLSALDCHVHPKKARDKLLMMIKDDSSPQFREQLLYQNNRNIISMRVCKNPLCKFLAKSSVLESLRDAELIGHFECRKMCGLGDVWEKRLRIYEELLGKIEDDDAMNNFKDLVKRDCTAAELEDSLNTISTLEHEKAELYIDQIIGPVRAGNWINLLEMIWKRQVLDCVCACFAQCISVG